ncbi:LysR family transcriptional regulator [Calothrix sp. PCC 6303]|uniref:LysR family transcriptional regulator n=1 Tax=Calothrix sp. PCC 6303 TaxID=1170562 RepID=UPI0002A04AB5|nr:LysR family transcriptional regulator [Calothrix sp. PCC 6303]AFZ04425.1 transcriptional regulator, LysR family [Calothrix sp. PCC 6303]
MNQPTLHQLKVFDAVVRYGSFNRAAKELFMSQPNVSLQIKELTQTVGLPLFEKVGRQQYLTDVGRELLGTCQEMFDTLSQFETKVADFKGLKQGQLRLAVIATGVYLIPQTLEQFCQIYPGVEVSLQIANDTDIVERILRNLDDLYITTQVPENVNVTSKTFIEDSLVVVAPINHPLVGQKNIPIQRLASESLIMREPGSGTRRTIQQHLNEHGVKVRFKVEMGSNEAIKQATVSGLGISILSRYTLNADNRDLAILDVESFPIQRNWYVVFPTAKRLSIVACAYSKYLLETADNLIKPMIQVQDGEENQSNPSSISLVA